MSHNADTASAKRPRLSSKDLTSSSAPSSAPAPTRTAEQSRLERMSKLRESVRQQDERAANAGGAGGAPPAPDDSGRVAKRLRKGEKVDPEGEGEAAGGGAMQQEEEDEDEEEEELDEEAQMSEMQRLMGFGGFNTTKNTKVEDNHSGSGKGYASVKKARKYRQYMNRKGGFDRNLDSIK